MITKYKNSSKYALINLVYKKCKILWRFSWCIINNNTTNSSLGWLRSLV